MVVVNGMKGHSCEVLQEELNDLGDHFKEDLNMVKVVNELAIVSNKSDAKKIKNMTDCIALVRNMSDGEKELLPQLVQLCKLYLVLPCSTASAERSFSQLRRVKSYLRSSMSQHRLNHLMILRAYKEKLDTISTKVILREFILANEQRQRTFALPTL